MTNSLRAYKVTYRENAQTQAKEYPHFHFAPNLEMATHEAECWLFNHFYGVAELIEVIEIEDPR